ncbi:MAG: hypothetical protein J6C33_03850 [Lachnospiraceae bacterium]|nr:hypothetical protein [Lachnospiraceae bacterium]
MKVRKYLAIGIIAALMLSAAGCGSKEEKVAETGASTETAAAAKPETDESVEDAEAEQGAGDDTVTGDLAELIGEKGAKLFEELSEEERAAMIPDTEVAGTGYYLDEHGRPEDYEFAGYMKEYEVIRQDWECILARGILENDYLKTEEPVEVTYFFSINEDETAVILTSPSIMEESDSMHIVPTRPLPEPEKLLNMGMITYYHYN